MNRTIVITVFESGGVGVRLSGHMTRRELQRVHLAVDAEYKKQIREFRLKQISERNKQLEKEKQDNGQRQEQEQSN